MEGNGGWRMNGDEEGVCGDHEEEEEEEEEEKEQEEQKEQEEEKVEKRLHEENEALRKQIMIISDEKRLVPQKDVVVSWSRKKFDLDAAINHFAELEAAGKKIGSIWEHIVKMVLRGELNRGRSEEMKKELISAGIPLFAQNKQPEQDTYDIGKCTTLSNINGISFRLHVLQEQASMRDLRKFANNTDKLVLYPTVERLPGESLADRKNEYLREARKKLLSACHPTPPSNKEVLELAMKMKAKSDQERGLYYRKVDDRDDNYKLDDYELMKRYLYQNLFKDRSGEYNF
ncbi:hypothetical protein GUITHDRAFT_145312 [Guillardia theta CCMP2712]|uniref:Uncharacterized protein n=1 Tax=Guillardia theta (strain CCMP2712) TaxID=905079 RepID=L1ILT2_GUITC|nr:hypothetical protein GUITHDRAFT_145312 [Guillardia theta CCMP2712]EKX37082.1 hypothetical protein GUITHDRAFT_145312 [Guillardia theta CCMP2712]|eukprot:XP_005824062.1 hypothetical protein GUITHDRAFT_145312 [Guillardia theta CCMP2712]